MPDEIEIPPLSLGVKLAVAAVIAAAGYVVWDEGRRARRREAALHKQAQDLAERRVAHQLWLDSHQPVEVYCLRHAEDNGERLTSLGVEQARAAGLQLADKLAWNPVKLLCSPEKRTVLTAEIIGLELGVQPEERAWLGFNSDRLVTDEVSRELSQLKRAGDQKLVLVTHSPHMEQLCPNLKIDENAVVHTATIMVAP